MSFCARAMVAAKRAVNAPMKAITVMAEVSSSPTRPAETSGKMRMARYTPAETIVAAWIIAETGVGPSIASGSQTCSGNCALLPTVPMNSRMPSKPASESPSTPESVAARVAKV